MTEQRSFCYDPQWIASRKFVCQQPLAHDSRHRWSGVIHDRQVEISWTTEQPIPHKEALAP